MNQAFRQTLLRRQGTGDPPEYGFIRSVRNYHICRRNRPAAGCGHRWRQDPQPVFIASKSLIFLTPKSRFALVTYSGLAQFFKALFRRFVGLLRDVRQRQKAAPLAHPHRGRLRLRRIAGSAGGPDRRFPGDDGRIQALRSPGCDRHSSGLGYGISWPAATAAVFALSLARRI